MQNKSQGANAKESRSCPYLDTVDRKVLDFDLEKECSVTLSHKNVYVCLVCGVYLQGRAENTPVYFHSMQEDHHVFLNTETKKFYCLPDNYEIVDHSLEDIKMALDPEFTPESIKKLDSNTMHYRVPTGDEYLPGEMGMNVVDNADYVNVVVQALSHVTPIRDFFLIPANYSYTSNPLVHSFGVLIRKLWSHTRFKCNVTPYEFLNEVTRSSNEKFTVKERRDASEFLCWLLNSLHTALKDKEHKTTVIDRCFKGRIEVTRRTYKLVGISGFQKSSRIPVSAWKWPPTTAACTSTFPRPRISQILAGNEAKVETAVKQQDYWMLSLDLPPIPLFRNSNNDSVVNKLPLYSLLKKFDGETPTKEIWENAEKTYRIVKLPRYLIFAIHRFQKNEFFFEKNTSIVQFPIRNMEMRHFFFPPRRAATVEFDLVANICHDVDLEEDREKKKRNPLLENPVTKGSYRIHMKNNADDEWYEIQELVVKPTRAELVMLSESSILVFERKD
ncbi:uncharacterized protein [Blastocystis hominis]|uniref:USP domain-containing protein n=1 Tax=Blastocystis hominis TaxID=12968 RepID=D8M6L2_BLAHO|nr:uncharacterized protein [Blastocystis hominis]CBK23430.2 unnamed protein product [Blastocystis hominis]|eukprot:XP_012897478.1 uncharacterized protein [Blastocystis hominis]